jgi:hypothetical protein
MLLNKWYLQKIRKYEHLCGICNDLFNNMVDNLHNCQLFLHSKPEEVLWSGENRSYLQV